MIIEMHIMFCIICFARSYLEGMNYLNCNNCKNAFIFLQNMKLDNNLHGLQSKYMLF